MTSRNTSENSAPLGQTPGHTMIFTKTGGGKSKLVTQAQIDELLNNPQPPEA